MPRTWGSYIKIPTPGLKVAVIGLGVGAALGAAAYIVLRYHGVTFQDFLFGTVVQALEENKAAKLETFDEARDRRLKRLGLTKRTAGLLQSLEEKDIIDLPDCELQANHAPFAIKWSRLARLHFTYPSDTPANRKIVSHWIHEEWKKMNVRSAHIVQALPLAITLTFARGNEELTALALEQTESYVARHAVGGDA